MPVICGGFYGAQVGPSSRMAHPTQWIGHAGFESRFQQTAARSSKSGDPEVNLTLAVIGGVKVLRGQVLIFNVVQQFRRLGAEHKSDARMLVVGHATPGG